MIPGIPKYAGMSWYRREDYERLRQIFVDAHVLPATFDSWLAKAERNLRDFEEAGCIVDKVIIDPDTFPAWCAERGLDVDAKARVDFANEFVARKYLKK